MASIATVTVRDFAILEANTPPPRSIWPSSQPPKISPLALVSAGIASVRMQRSPLGSVSVAGGAWTWLSVMPVLSMASDADLQRRDHRRHAPYVKGAARLT